MSSYDGLTFNTDDQAIHLGGNVREGDPYTYSPKVWDYVISRFAIGSVLDLGSGLGYSAAYFFRKGLRVVAVDGLEANVRGAVYPTIRVDITQSKVICPVDLVHCQEVVEHIEERYLGNLLDSICNGKFVLMTHALPGQGGHHHVNLQPSQYWIDHMHERGFTHLVEDSLRVRRLAESEGAMYLQSSGLLFARRAG
jgi:hypothetical protein